MIHVTLTTEEGVVLDQFSLERTSKSIDGKPLPFDDFIPLSKEVREVLEYRYEVDDDLQ